MLSAIDYSEAGGLEVLDQLKLPTEKTFVKVANVEDGFNVIKNMQVRGAPAIAIVGMLSMTEELKSLSFASTNDLIILLDQRLQYLVTSRPTAVNLATAANEMIALAHKQSQLSVEELRAALIAFSSSMLVKDLADNRAIGRNGADEIIKPLSASKNAAVLTHCNTGSLATSGYGTALGVVRALHESGRLSHVYCTETRPYNQGARLTAYELVHDALPATLICDSMVALLMQSRTVNAVVVGADRVAANGDTANKIGTYQLAIVARRFNVPFYVCAPLTSVDMSLESGSQIPIEERAADEMACVKGIRIAAPGINCWNPAFDITPAELITGIITEKGVVSPGQLSSVA